MVFCPQTMYSLLLNEKFFFFLFLVPLLLRVSRLMIVINSIELLLLYFQSVLTIIHY